MDAVTNLFLLMLVLSGIFLALGLACAVIERWPALLGQRPRRAPRRVRRPRRRGRSGRLRRAPGVPSDLAVPVARSLCAAPR